MIITEINIQEGLNRLFRAPQFEKFQYNKDSFYEIIFTFMKDLYVDVPKDQVSYMNYILSDKMVRTMFHNYGISPDYYTKLVPELQRRLVFYLEYLFQNKGSTKILDILRKFFEIFFSEIDFYNIIVNKLKTANDNYVLAYGLKPLLVDGTRIYFPSTPVNYINKFLMKLSNFNNMQLFPIDTNLIYINYNDSYGTVNNFKLFYQGCAAYANTKFQNLTFKFSFTKSTGENTIINIDFIDIEPLLMYVHYKSISELGTTEEQKNFKPKVNPYIFSSTLRFDLGFLDTIEDLLRDYQKLNYSDRKEVNDFKRRWEYLLRYNLTKDNKIAGIEIFEYLEKKYPDLTNTIINLTSMEELYDLFTKLYVTTSEAIPYDASDKYTNPYINAVFQEFLYGPTFIRKFFEPVFNLFVKYFMPCNLGFANKIGNKLTIKDKFNTVATEDISLIDLYTNTFSTTIPKTDDIFNNIKININESEIESKDNESLEIFSIQNDLNPINENIKYKRSKGKLNFTLDEYLWKKQRNVGITKYDKQWLLYDQFITTDGNNINTYLYYNFNKLKLI